jgi:hypothetical protein
MALSHAGLISTAVSLAAVSLGLSGRPDEAGAPPAGLVPGATITMEPSNRKVARKPLARKSATAPLGSTIECSPGCCWTLDRNFTELRMSDGNGS